MATTTENDAGIVTQRHGQIAVVNVRGFRAAVTEEPLATFTIDGYPIHAQVTVDMDALRELRERIDRVLAEAVSA